MQLSVLPVVNPVLGEILASVVNRGTVSSTNILMDSVSVAP